MTTPYVNVSHVMDQVAALDELHTEAEQAHADAAAEHDNRRPASPLPAWDDQAVQ